MTNEQIKSLLQGETNPQTILLAEIAGRLQQINLKLETLVNAAHAPGNPASAGDPRETKKHLRFG